MSLSIFMHFNGNCREAAEFYARVFDAPLPRITTYGEVPSIPGVPLLTEKEKQLIAYAELAIEGTVLTLADMPPGMACHSGDGIGLRLVCNNLATLETRFHRLREGGSIQTPLQKTIWAERYGVLTDRFGLTWHCSYLADPI